MLRSLSLVVYISFTTPPRNAPPPPPPLSPEQRPSKKQLQAAGIIPRTKLAPTLLNIGARLEKKIKQDSIKQTLETRPTRAMLIAAGIYIDQTPTEIASAKSAQRKQLKAFLKKRPAPDTIRSVYAEEPLVAVDGTAAPGVALLHFALSQ